MIESTVRGACLCGAVRFSVTGRFVHFVLCHCSRCRKGSGSAHAANLFAPGARIEWLAGEAHVRRFELPDTRHLRQFCDRCGAPMPAHHPAAGAVVVPAGCLDDPLPMGPDLKIFCADRAGWVDAMAAAARFDGLPEP